MFVLIVAVVLTTNMASGQAAPAPAAVGVASAAADRNDYVNEEDRSRTSRGGGVHRRDLSRQELVEAAARAGMEIVDSEDQDWVHAARRLAYAGEGVAVWDYAYGLTVTRYNTEAIDQGHVTRADRVAYLA